MTDTLARALVVLVAACAWIGSLWLQARHSRRIVAGVQEGE